MSGAAFFLLLANAGTTPALRSFANSKFDGEGAQGAGLVRAVQDHLRNLLTALNNVLLAFIGAVSKTEELRLCCCRKVSGTPVVDSGATAVVALAGQAI